MSSSAFEKRSVKRRAEFVVALLLCLVALPVIGALMLLIRLDSPGNPLFKQVRVGRGGRTYTIYKLRTLRRESFGIFPLEEIRWGDHRVTRVGHILRRTKLDELPQLFNVLNGDMSFVGPRPDLPIQAQDYGAHETLRLVVRPGLTGLTQVSGNTWLTWPQRIELDRWYVQHRSMWLDMLILLHTVPILVRGERSSDDPLRARQQLSITLSDAG